MSSLMPIETASSSDHHHGLANTAADDEDDPEILARTQRYRAEQHTLTNQLTEKCHPRLSTSFKIRIRASGQP